MPGPHVKGQTGFLAWQTDAAHGKISSDFHSKLQWSMAMQQDPIDWRYRFHIYSKAYCLGLNSGNIPSKYGQKYGTNVPPF